ncbi:MAG: hypothetical protein KDI83_13215, partial [Gammaproteobacteria bacterium]|nr:hypothetical protein [Gammaproteobacteria bacterium]
VSAKRQQTLHDGGTDSRIGYRLERKTPKGGTVTAADLIYSGVTVITQESDIGAVIGIQCIAEIEEGKVECW